MLPNSNSGKAGWGGLLRDVAVALRVLCAVLWLLLRGVLQVRAGESSPVAASLADIALATVRVLQHTVPPAVPGIMVRGALPAPTPLPQQDSVCSCMV